MNSIKYLEIDSTYRNRNSWPEISDFEIPVSVSGRKNCANAVDPVALSAPVLWWRSNNFDVNNYPETFVTANVIATGANSIIIEEVNVGDFQKGEKDLREEYYEGAQVITALGYRSVITRWETLSDGSGNQPMRVDISVTIPFTEAIDTVISIIDPTNISSGDGSNPIVFVPRGPSENNSFISYYLFNDTRNEGRPIFYYNGLYNTAGIDTSEDGPVPSWTATDCYSIRKEIPIFCGEVFIDPTIGGGPSSKSTFILDEQYLKNPINSFIQLQNTSIGNFVDEIRPVVKYYKVTGTAFSGNISSIVIPYNTGSKSGDYTSLYIRIIDGTSAGDTRFIINHIVNRNGNKTPVSETITVSTKFTSSPDSTSVYSINSGVVSPSFTNNIADSQFCYLPCSYDNLNPLLHTMCISESNEMTCYEIELVNLILPNKIINVYTGGRLASHPYLYVRLSNSSSAGGHLKNVFYSNNPMSTNALFRAKVGDTSDLLTPFVKLSGDGTVLTIKFKPNDNFRFSVFFKDGSNFDTIRYEHYSPREPNYLLQISAMFAIKKVYTEQFE